jgi:hypothetical protein
MFLALGTLKDCEAKQSDKYTNYFVFLEEIFCYIRRLEVFEEVYNALANYHGEAVCIYVYEKTITPKNGSPKFTKLMGRAIVNMESLEKPEELLKAA